MFEDSLVESGGRLARRNPWTIAFSLALQIFAGGILVLMSMVYTETLPRHTGFVCPLPVPPLATAPAPMQQVVTRWSRQTSEFSGDVLTPPREIPKQVMILNDVTPPGNPLVNSGPGVSNGTGDGVTNSVITEVLRSTPVTIPKASATKIRISSGVARGLLIREIKPQYPALARQARIQGIVVLQATIGKDGTVQNLRVISGHPMLTGAAIAAARQWLYKPYYLNGEPVEVDTQINVIFTLAGE